MRNPIGSRKRQAVAFLFTRFLFLVFAFLSCALLRPVFALSAGRPLSNQPKGDHALFKRGAAFSDTIAAFQEERGRIKSSFIEGQSFEAAREERTSTFAGRTVAFFKRGDLRNAREEARRILTLDVANQEGRELLRQVLERQHRRNRVKSFLSEDSEVSLKGWPDRRGSQIEILIARAEQLKRIGLYDPAVDQLEKVFILDPLNPRASGKIDRIRVLFLQAAKSELRGESLRHEKTRKLYGEEASLWVVEQRIRERRFAEAKTLLNQLLIPEWGSGEGRNSREPVYEREALRKVTGT